MGCGYIGLPTAITFTLAGYEVCGFDVKAETVEILNQGKIHIVEPGLQEAHAPRPWRRAACISPRTPEPADVFIIAVQTPYRETPEKKRVSDMRFVESAAREVGSVIRPGGSLRAGIHLASRLDAARRADRLRGQRPEAGGVYDGPLPRAHHSGADAP